MIFFKSFAWSSVSDDPNGCDGRRSPGLLARGEQRSAAWRVPAIRSRSLIVYTEIDSLIALREKIFGVQSVSGGLWVRGVIGFVLLGAVGQEAKKAWCGAGV